MNPKLSVIGVVLLAFASQTEALEINQETAHDLAITFLVLCCVVLFIVLIIPIILYQKKETRDRAKAARSCGSQYDVAGASTSGKPKSFTSSHNDMALYGIYNDPTTPTGSIYLPLDRDKMVQEEGGYAHLETRNKNGTDEGTHTYETLKAGSTFKQAENAYENPEAAKSGSDSGSEHEYELAEATISGPTYENPVPVKNDEISL